MRLNRLRCLTFQCQCNPKLEAQLHFVFLGAVAFTALEGILLINASIRDAAPSSSLFYIVIGYVFSLAFAVLGVAKFANYTTRAEQLCILDIDSGAGWLMLGPVIVSDPVSLIGNKRRFAISNCFSFGEVVKKFERATTVRLKYIHATPFFEKLGKYFVTWPR